MIIGATNRPHEIDEAARRRLVKRLYIPLPAAAARKQILVRTMRETKYTLTDEEITAIVEKSAGCVSTALQFCNDVLPITDTPAMLPRFVDGRYSGSDMANLCKDAAMAPLRAAMRGCLDFSTVTDSQVRTLRVYRDAIELELELPS